MSGVNDAAAGWFSSVQAPADAIRELTSRSELDELLGLPRGTCQLVANSPGSYSTFEISKRSGGKRTIWAPRARLAHIQKRLSLIFQAIHQPRHAAHGYLAGRSIVTNARGHVARPWVLKADLEDFFPSIHFGRVFGLLRHQSIGANEDVAGLIAQLLTVDGGLPIGSPASPVVSNMIAMKLDGDLMRLASREGCYYTRYVDDLTFSSVRPLPPGSLVALHGGHAAPGGALVSAVEDNGFRLNLTKFALRRANVTQRVAGIVVNQRPNVDRRYIRRIRAMLFNWEQNGIEAAQARLDRVYSKDRHTSCDAPRFLDVLRGMIGYVAMVKGADDDVVVNLRSQFENLANDKPRVMSSIIADSCALPNAAPVVLHISDLHFRSEAEQSSDQTAHLSRLIEYVSTIGRIDIVAVTGDIAWSGSAAEYLAAEDWLRRLLKTLEVPVSQLALAPGNHDLDRTAIREITKGTRAELRSAQPSDQLQRTITALIKEPRDLFAPLGEYMKFSARFGRELNSKPWWVDEFEVEGQCIQFASVCSAWLCQDDDDKGKLAIGLEQVAELRGDESRVNIALLHHPWSYLSDADKPAETEMTNWADIVLSGHVHHRDSAVITRPGRQHIECVAGAAYQGSEMEHSFNLLRIDASSQVAEVETHTFGADRVWHQDPRYPTEQHELRPT